MSDSPSQPKAKRQRIDKSGRSAALDKLRQLKGAKNKFDLSENIDNIYEEIDEAEYVKRTGIHWIENPENGYCEEDSDEEIVENTKVKESKKKQSKKKLHDINAKATGKRSILDMFSSSNAVKKDALVKLEDDNILSDILGEIKEVVPKTINSNEKLVEVHRPHEIKTAASEAALVKEYMKTFSKNIKKKETPRKEENNSDDDIIDKIFKPELKKISSKQITELQKDDNTETNDKANKIVKDNQKIISDNKEFIESGFETGNDFALGDFEDDIHLISNSCIDDVKISDVIPEKIVTNIVQEPKLTDVLHEWESNCPFGLVDDDFLNDVDEKIDDNILDEKQELKFWFWDAWENPKSHSGDVFLFGKIPIQGQKKSFQSICVHVQNIERCLYLLPREYALDGRNNETTNKVVCPDVLNELKDTIVKDLRLTNYRTKKVTKKFSFDVPDIKVAETCEYIELRYSAKYSTPKVNTRYNTIEHIFGINTTALETFLVDCKIKGPCWLTISDYSINKNSFSWCKQEVICKNMKFVSVSSDRNQSPPPIVVASLNVRAIENPQTNFNEIVAISCLVHNKFCIDKPAPNPPFTHHFCGITKPLQQNWPIDLTTKLGDFKATQVTKFDNEQSLLSWFLAKFQNIDPDLVVTHDANACQLELICERVHIKKLPLNSRTSRLKIINMIGKRMTDCFAGRMICDIKHSAQELIKSRSYDLGTLCVNVLKLEENARIELHYERIQSMFENGDDILKLITLTMQDCSYTLRIMCELNVLPLALQITTICGNLMSRTLLGGRAERNEYLLLHAFTERDFIVPDKKVRELTSYKNGKKNDSVNTANKRKKAAYAGGLVLDPLVGFYDKYILLMDFNSLYPSIIQEYNICFTTINAKDSSDQYILPDSSVEQGVLPRQIRRLVESRREVKKLMKNPDLDTDLRIQYNIRQLALKLTANSMYGCLGFSQSRFYAQHLAALVTQKGREILMNTKSLVQKLNFQVIYGDTDSIMINTNSENYEDVHKIGFSIKQAVNKIYRQVELDVDGVFKYLLLLKKKKYAAVVVSKGKNNELKYEQELKGLDIVRRDWSQIAVMAGKFILDELLSDNQMDDRISNIQSHLEQLKNNLNEGNIPLSLLIITKQLTRPLLGYTSIQSLPHVMVAIRMNLLKKNRFRKGDVISYIICEDGTENPAMQRAYHLEEIQNKESLKPDVNYYLAQQIHPVISRMLEPIDGIDATQIAMFLGLDPSKYKTTIKKPIETANVTEGESIIKTAYQKYRFCEKFTFTCVACKSEILVAAAFKNNSDNQIVPVLQYCSNSACKIPPFKYITAIMNSLVLTIRKFINRFYKNWYFCNNPKCNANIRGCIAKWNFDDNCYPCIICQDGNLIRQYSEEDLYYQLSYFQYMFDLSTYEKQKIKLPAEVTEAYDKLKNSVDEFLYKSEFFIINLGEMFDLDALKNKFDIDQALENIPEY